MSTAPAERTALRRLLSGARFAALATCAGSRPHACLVAVAPGQDPNTLLFATLRNTRKYRNLKANPRAALLLDERPRGRRRTGAAVTATGHARELRGAGRDRALTLLVGLHRDLAGFARAPDCAVFALRVDRFRLATGVRAVSDHRPLPRRETGRGAGPRR
jgi:nitroimidazol reductase NimA-like FMN-containing flavoprotein (pyridoxamine 5'-phosphate oxidase superfamily)